MQYKIIGFVPSYSIDRCPNILLLLLDSFIVARWILLFFSFLFISLFALAQSLDSMCMG